MALDVRTTKVLRDLWLNRSQTLLMVLAVAVGTAAFGLMLTGGWVLAENLQAQYASTRPAHAVLDISTFDENLLEDIRSMRGVEASEARRLIRARINTGPDKWSTLDLEVAPDLAAVGINRLLLPDTSVLDARSRTIHLEQSLAALSTLAPGATATLQWVDGTTSKFSVGAWVNDLSRLPSGISHVANGYTSYLIPEAPGETGTFNRLYLVVAGGPKTREPIERVVTEVVSAIEDDGYRVSHIAIPPPGKQVMADNMSSVLLILRSLGVLILLLGGFLVTNVMSAAIQRQIPQIAILKSMGGTAGQIMGLYILQVLIIGFMALFLAVPMGLGGAYFLAAGMSSGMNFSVTHFFVPPMTLVLQAASALLLPVLAASLPVWRGVHLTVREALSDAHEQAPSATSIWTRLLEATSGLAQIVRMSLLNTFRHRGRVALTLATLCLAGAMFVAVLGIRQSLRQAVADIQAEQNFDVSIDFNQPYPVERIMQVVDGAGGIQASETWTVSSGRLVMGDRLTGSMVLIGVPAGSALTRPTVTAGRRLQADDDRGLFGNADTLDLNPGVGVGSVLRLRIGPHERTWRLVGVGARGFIPVAYVQTPALDAATGLREMANRLVVRTDRADSAYQSRVQADLMDRFAKARLEVSDTGTTTDVLAGSQAQLDILVVLLLVMVLLIAVVGGLGLAITMSLNVMERTKEIGILRSLGATDRVVRTLMVRESLVLVLISWGIGLLLSIPLGMWLGDVLGMKLLSRPLDYIFSLPGALTWLLLAVAIAYLASLAPARRASRLTIRDTLAYIG